MSQQLHDTIVKQRKLISELIGNTCKELADKCEPAISDRDKLENLLTEQIVEMQYCKYLYVLDHNAIQLTSNITRTGTNSSHYNRDRKDRPYMKDFKDGEELHLSEAYISASKKRPSITAIQNITNSNKEIIGYLGLDYDIRELPHVESTFKESKEWKQIKGDPAIRNNLFQQNRVNSAMDDDFEAVSALMVELMTQHGVFHGKLHFSSSRATIWLADDPYDYQILDYADLADPDTCLAFPRRPYFDRSIVPPEDISKVFRLFNILRFCDETIYLRAGSLNTVNGMVGLNFSCDGSHYIPYKEFLEKDVGFWFGGNLIKSEHIDKVKIDNSVDQICIRGCNYVYSTIDKINNNEEVGLLDNFSDSESQIVLEELKSIMSVYQAKND